MDEHRTNLTGGPVADAPLDAFQADAAAVNGIEALHKILKVVCQTTGMGFAAVARASKNRWIACAVRDKIQMSIRSGGELPAFTAIGEQIRKSRQTVVVSNAATHSVHHPHPSQDMYAFQSYIATPIILADGTFFGTLCALDILPADLVVPQIADMFELMSELIAFHVTALDRPVLNEDRLHPERERAEMREQFIAVVGHDLRNPLAAIGANVATLRLMLIDQKALRTIGRIEESAFRMAGIVDDMMDLARGYLGGELALDRDLDAPLAPVLGQVIAELCAAWPDRAVETHFAIVEPVRCDHRRIGQLFSNILGNALTYGAANAPVRVQAVTDGVTFQLSVSNAGDPIPPATLQQLFHPFFRGANSPNKQGLGLGLHIASEVARAHGGTLEAVSSPEETRFTFRMPL